MIVWDWLDWAKVPMLLSVLGIYAWYLRGHHPHLTRIERVRQCAAIGAFGAVYLAIWT